MIKLDYSLETPEERNELVKKILEENPNPGEYYLEILANYLIFCMEKQEKKKKKILTENRMITVDKRETSFEGLISQLENGEDGIYNLIKEDKNQIFRPKVSITKADLETIPPLAQLRESIAEWEQRFKKSEGKEAYIIKQALIEMRKDQYVIKDAYVRPIVFTKLSHSKVEIALPDYTSKFDEKNYPIPEGISLLDYNICSIILCNYSKLKQEGNDRLNSDLKWLMEDFDAVADLALEETPIYEEIVKLKIDGLQNAQIREELQKKFGILHSIEYISSLWRNKIPKMIASVAEDQFLDWYFLNREYGKYKKCSRCGEIKLAHNKYFSKNKTSRDGFYSICKKCRNSKDKKK